jgi:hypothetical protein
MPIVCDMSSDIFRVLDFQIWHYLHELKKHGQQEPHVWRKEILGKSGEQYLAYWIMKNTSKAEEKFINDTLTVFLYASLF